MEAIKLTYGYIYKDNDIDHKDVYIHEKSFKNWNWVLKTLEDDWQDDYIERALILIQGGKS